ncbi:MAG: DNA mismatch repair protein [Bacteroidetes bacterium]|nr:DNA mismatch repair protein [Bacteroidota bacterium]
MKKGDLVSVINEDMKGEIMSVHGDEVIVQDEFGFTHRYKKSDLLPRDEQFYHNLKVEKKIEKERVKTSKKHNKNHLILDLHFEKLVDNPTDYIGFERLFIQKQKLLDTLEFCREHRLKKMEIIHGLGEGTVQTMVINALQDQVDLEFHHLEILQQQSGNIMVYFK